MSDSSVFVQRTSGGGCYALLLVFLIFPVMGVVSYLGEGALLVGAGVILGILGLAAALVVFVRAEYRFELGPGAVRLTERQTVFGFGRPEVVHWELAAADLTAVKQVNTRTPSSRGGWNHGSALHFPGGHVLNETFLGSREKPDSEYNRLVATLRARLGDRFTVEDKV